MIFLQFSDEFVIVQQSSSFQCLMWRRKALLKCGLVSISFIFAVPLTLKNICSDTVSRQASTILQNNLKKLFFRNTLERWGEHTLVYSQSFHNRVLYLSISFSLQIISWNCHFNIYLLFPWVWFSKVSHWNLMPVWSNQEWCSWQDDSVKR